jgi:hypothetical protein
MALTHTSTLKNIRNILSLREKEPRSGTSDSNPKKEMKISKVCHGELTMQPVKKLLQELSGGGGDNGVVHVEE